MDIFNKEGHINKDFFESIMNEKASEYEILLFSDHISVCEKCMEKYINMTESSLDDIEFDEEAINKNIFDLIKKYKKYVLNRRYLNYAIAASFTFVIWFSGFADAIQYKSEELYLKTKSSIEMSVKEKEVLKNKIEEVFDFENIKGVFDYGKK